MGYLFSVIYYLWWNKREVYYDHASALLALEKIYGIRFIDVSNLLNNQKDISDETKPKVLNSSEFDKYFRWEIFHAVWHRVRGQSDELKANDERTERLLDILHGHGITYIGSQLSCAVWIVYVLIRQNWTNWWVPLIVFALWLLLIRLIRRLYFITRKTVNNILNMALINNFDQNEFSPQKVFFVSQVND